MNSREAYFCCGVLELGEFTWYNGASKNEIYTHIRDAIHRGIRCFIAQTSPYQKDTAKYLKELGFSSKKVLSAHGGKNTFTFWFLDFFTHKEAHQYAKEMP